VSVRPSDFPPPWSPAEAIGAPTDPVDERIDVGFLIVGAGPAGLAAAIRLGQLMEEHPETAERLGRRPATSASTRPVISQPMSACSWVTVVRPPPARSARYP